MGKSAACLETATAQAPTAGPETATAHASTGKEIERKPPFSAV